MLACREQASRHQPGFSVRPNGLLREECLLIQWFLKLDPQSQLYTDDNGTETITLYDYITVNEIPAQADTPDGDENVTGGKNAPTLQPMERGAPMRIRAPPMAP